MNIETSPPSLSRSALFKLRQFSRHYSVLVDITEDLVIDLLPRIMNSSVKYEKFAGSQDEDKQKSTGGRKKILIVGMLVVAIVAISVVAIVAIGVGVGVSAGHDSEQSGLIVITVAENKIEGEYYGSAGGIYFSSFVNGSDTNLTIVTISGEIIISARHPQDASMAMMSLNDTTHFLFMKDQPGNDFYNSQDFTIPENNSKVMKSMIENNPTVSEVMRMVDGTNAEENYQYSFEHAIMRPEAVLIIEAAQVLGGQHNVTGSDYQPAMQFYLLALTLAEARNSMERIQSTSLTTPRQKQKHSIHRRDSCGSVPSYVIAKLSGGICHLECPSSDCTSQHRCPQKTADNNCFGMCGPECYCWGWVCPDEYYTSDRYRCCQHNVCRDHDQCCSVHGLASWNCVKILKQYLCSSNFCSERFRCE